MSEIKNRPSFKIVTDRVIELTYDEFDEEKGASYLNKNDMKMGGCSAVKVLINNKVYVGRNYDFYCSDTPSFIVRNNAGKIRTIGVGNSPASLDEWKENYKIRDEVLDALPFLCCDVMSEAGLYCETNIRPYERELSCQSTNPVKKRRCSQTFMQTMLSSYSSIDEILSHLDDYDWFDLSRMGFEQSFFLSDQSGRSVIIEFVSDHVCVQEGEYNANFFINNEAYKKETLGCGELRLSRELAYKPFVRNEEDIFVMMKKGAYDQFYHKECDEEFALPEYYELVGYDKISASLDKEGALRKTKEKIKELSSWTWEERIRNKSWESTFIIAANITDLYLNVNFSEHYDIHFKVTF